MKKRDERSCVFESFRLKREYSIMTSDMFKHERVLMEHWFYSDDCFYQFKVYFYPLIRTRRISSNNE
uniref:Ovule protein n=1 Tax=Caenorhabditis tropicalis TaxID=1561998 RepID=A0A1I7SZ85_9PELO